MFPLGTVLVPGMPLPLHVFEPRYRQLMHDCLAGTPEFGVTLIERGSEVGGGEVRVAVGTVARIVEAGMMEDGRWMLVAIGTRRIRVLEWLVDDPYPRAEVDDWPDPEVEPGALDGLIDLQVRLRRVLALKAELGDPAVQVDVELADDPVLATWQVAASSGLGPFDLYRVLGTEGPVDRLMLVDHLLTDEEELLTARLAAG